MHLPQHRRRRHDQHGRHGVSGRSQHQSPTRGGGAAGDQQGLAEDHLLQQTLQEVAAPLHRLQARRPGLIHTKRARQGPGEPVDRRALLGARGEIDTAQQRRRIVARAAKSRMQELHQHRLEARDLTGEHRDPRPPVRVALGLQAVEQPRIQSLHQGAQFAGEGGDGTIVIPRRVERRAPDLRAPLAVEVVEELGEPGDQVRLGEQHIDRHPHAEPRLQLLDPAADRRRMRLAFGGRSLGDVAEREGDQQAVQRLPRPGLFSRSRNASQPARSTAALESCVV